MLDLKVLTFNVWMLPIPVPRRTQTRRLHRIVASLRELDADIVAIQEAFDPVARRGLVEALGDQYHVSGEALEVRRAMRLLRVDRTGGLLTLSKYPIRHSSFTAHPLPLAPKFPERLGVKGMLRSTLETPAGRLDFFNVHFYAGGRPKDRAARRMQLHHFSRMLGSATETDPLIIAGDFNAWSDDGSPVEQRSQSEYTFLRKVGLLDADDGHGTGTHITYNVDSNKLAAWWSSRKQGGQEFDTIFYRSSARHDVEMQTASVVLNDATDPLSDHYGYMAEFRVIPKVS
jgi:endonuclease/exonuclease/phosphatase family metal-dependent hydrolase